LDGTFASGDSVSRLINFGSATASTGGTDTMGLVTEFVAVPEAASFMLTFVGMAMLFATYYRRFARA